MDIKPPFLGIRDESIYQHQPLQEEANHVRLMTLLPEERQTPLKILIDIVELAEAEKPMYEALSYTWGSAENPMNTTVEYSENAT